MARGKRTQSSPGTEYNPLRGGAGHEIRRSNQADLRVRRFKPKKEYNMRILILGATSMLAHETAKNLLKEGAELVLVARSPEKLTTIANDLSVRGAKQVATIQADLDDLAHHQEDRKSVV